jgi:transposase
MHPSWRSPPRRGLLENSRDVLTTALASISRKSSLAVLFAAASHAGQASPRLAHDGRLEMTKNAINRAIRPLASARRNYLFACSDADDGRATILYTPDPERDPQRPPSRGLSALHLARIADHRINGIDDLLPWTWAASLRTAAAAWKLDHGRYSPCGIRGTLTLV